MSDDKNPIQDIKNISITSSGKEGGVISTENSFENLVQDGETQSLNELSSKPETEIEKLEKVSNTIITNQGQNTQFQQNQLSKPVPMSSTNLPITLADAIKLTKGFFLFKDSSDPLLWLSFLIIKNFKDINKNKK